MKIEASSKDNVNVNSVFETIAKAIYYGHVDKISEIEQKMKMMNKLTKALPW